MAHLLGWQAKGFATAPALESAPASGLLVYRCWGGFSTEWGTGYFSLEKPASVLDAELRFNIVDWGNGIRFVSTFLVRPSAAYWIGPVAHAAGDQRRAGNQVYVQGIVQASVSKLISRQRLEQDFSVVVTAGECLISFDRDVPC